MFVMRTVFALSALLYPMLPATSAEKDPKEKTTYLDPAMADADFAYQGEYTGELTAGGEKKKIGLQIIAMGDGNFQAVYHNGGLPGDGYDKSKRERVSGKLENDTVTFTGAAWVGKLKEKMVAMSDSAGASLGQLAFIKRESPTIGAKPPEGAVVLFDGTNLDQWQAGAKMTEDKLLQEGANSKPTYQSCLLHVEFFLPYKPFARGQGRGNSGVYLQARYETQVLDSFGLDGKMNETGGIYSIKAPDINMCFPPLQWQTYDTEFTAAQYEDGKKVKNARMTVRLNGVVVQDDVELPKTTTAAPLKESPEPGHLHIQNHGNPVRFRNIWFAEKK